MHPAGTSVLPKDPCNVFYKMPPKPDPVTKANQKNRSSQQTAMQDASRDAFNPRGGGGIKQKVNEKRSCGRPAGMFRVHAPGADLGAEVAPELRTEETSSAKTTSVRMQRYR